MRIPGLLTENLKIVEGLAPVADALAATVNSDAVNMGIYEKALIVLHRGAGTTGTQTLTVIAASDNAATGATAIPFKYRRVNLGGSPVDDGGDWTQATAAGFTTVAGGSDIYAIDVDQADITEGLSFINLKSVEVVDAAVLAGITIFLANPRVGGDDLPSAV